MSINRRYMFLKKLFPNTLIIFKKNYVYFCISFDRLVFNRFGKDLNNIIINDIDYIIIDNLVIKEYSFFTSNNYLKYSNICSIERFIEKYLF